MPAGLESILIIFILMALGFFFTRKNWWPESTPSGLSAIVVKAAAPALALISFYNRLTPEMLRSSVILIGIVFLHMFLMLGGAKVCSRILKLQGDRKVIFEVSFMFANVTFIGLPVISITLGEDAIVYLFIVYFVSVFLFWSLGAYLISTSTHVGKPAFSVKKVFSPGLVAVIIGIFLVESQLKLPFILTGSITYLANICVPLSLLVIGSRLLPEGKPDLKLHKSEVAVMAGKFILSPVLMFLLLKLFGISGLPFQVLFLASTMPCHMQTSILAQHYQVESAYASKLVSLSTLLSLITIPMFVAVLHWM